jgi:O-antigen/teichoic acid export membrane protein
MSAATYIAEPRASLARRVRQSSLHSNSVWIMLAIAIPSCLGYAYWVAVAHMFPAAQVGLATGLVSLMTVTAIVSNLGTSTALVQRLPARASIRDWSTTLSSCLIGGALFGACAGMLVLALLPLLSHRLAVAQRDPVLALLLIAGTSCCIVSMVLDYAFIAERRSRSMSVRGALFGIIKIPLVVVPPLALSAGSGTTIIFASWVLAYAISSALGFAIMVPKLRPGFAFRLKGGATELRTITRLLAGNHFIELGNTLPLYILPVIVVSRLSSTANAYLYITWMVGGIFFMISSSIGASLFAEGSRRPARVTREALASARFTALLLAPAMLFVFITGRWILALFGSAYSENGTHLLWVLTLAAIPDAVTNIYVAVLRVRRRLRAAGLLTMGMALTTIGGAWLVAPHLKLVGIGIVWLLGQTVGSLWVAWDSGAVLRIFSWIRRSAKPEHDVPVRAPHVA